jgi:hypothetical protein
MLDFNHKPNLSEQICARIDGALQSVQAQQTPRNYLGASRLGVACDRALQFEYLNAPVDEGREFSGQTLRVRSLWLQREMVVVRHFCLQIVRECLQSALLIRMGLALFIVRLVAGSILQRPADFQTACWVSVMRAPKVQVPHNWL